MTGLGVNSDPRGTYSLVDGGGLRTFLCDPMHTLRSSGYTLFGIFISLIICRNCRRYRSIAGIAKFAENIWFLANTRDMTPDPCNPPGPVNDCNYFVGCIWPAKYLYPIVPKMVLNFEAHQQDRKSHLI